MDLKETKDLKRLISLLKKSQVKSIKMEGIELEFKDVPPVERKKKPSTLKDVLAQAPQAAQDTPMREIYSPPKNHGPTYHEIMEWIGAPGLPEQE